MTKGCQPASRPKKITYELYGDIEFFNESKQRLVNAGATVKKVAPLKDYQQSQQIIRNKNQSK